MNGYLVILKIYGPLEGECSFILKEYYNVPHVLELMKRIGTDTIHSGRYDIMQITLIS